MLLTNDVNEVEGVNSGQVMMATDANKDIFKGADLYTDELEAAGANDMAIVIDAEDESVLETVKEIVDDFLSDLSASKAADTKTVATNWKEALEAAPEANLALVSIPGQYAADEIERALDEGLNVHSFSDNVSLEDETRLKEKAHEKGLLLMGPDSGTGTLAGVPIAFTNVVNPGNIGIVGASGTGIQEAASIIDRLGGGVTNAIGVGGRDLNEAVGARTTLDAIYALEQDPTTDVVLVISKPPAKEVRDEVVNTLQSLSKPAVAVFLGEKPEEHVGNVSLAYTLEEAAKMAMDLANGEGVRVNYTEPIQYEVTETLPEEKTVKGLYSGGTLASEAGMLISDALGLGKIENKEGYILNENGFQVADLGDDTYTQGRPHPMIDPSVRLEKLDEAIEDENTGVILFDVVLGYGSHADMASELAEPIKEALETAKENGRPLYAVASVVGTDNDPQDYAAAVAELENAGVIVAESNEKAVRTALALMGEEVVFPDKQRVEFTGEKVELPTVSDSVKTLISEAPKVINIGVESFVEPIETFGGQAVQFDWRPKAGGNPELIKILNELEKMPEIQEANEIVTKRMEESQPFLVDVKPAYELIPALNTDEKIILHAGPPLKFEDMTGPAVGAITGAMMYEGWATDEEDALAQIEAGEVKFDSCHHHSAVGPMGGITTKNFPLLVVENKVDGTPGYCAMNEGIGKVMRFGANGPEVIERLNWQRDVLGPVLSKALKTLENGLNINVIISQAITMGDEFHQRNIAASALFNNEMAPIITGLDDVSTEDKEAVIQFLADTDQFFLNIAMATGKAVVDYARQHEEGTIVTTMARNGHMFGVRIAGMGDQWFEAPVNTPKGLYFTGYSEEDGNPDIGDSAITETIGLGGVAMIAAPGVTRFVGADGFSAAVDISNSMDKIYISNNPNWSIPNWDFKGSVSGLDAQKVTETGLEPIINTGIANKVAGQGQVGAGTVTAPVQAFEKALYAYADKLGIDYK
jgi:succinyl-CoA synthetase alpha subunit